MSRSASNSFRKTLGRFWRFCRSRPALMVPPLLLAGAIALLMVPVPLMTPTWRAFEWSRLYVIWPVAVLAGMIYFWRYGVVRRAVTGQVVFAPWMALVAVVCLGLVHVLLGGSWPVDRGQTWCGIATGILWLASLAAAIGAIGYGQWWRVLFSNQVVETVREALGNRTFGQFQKSRDNVMSRKSIVKWGSLHEWRIVIGHYEQKRREVLAYALQYAQLPVFNRGNIAAPRPQPDATDVTRALEDYQYAARVAIEYLGRRWNDEDKPQLSCDWKGGHSAEGLAPEIYRRMRQRNLLHELILLTLWFDQDARGKVRVQANQDEVLSWLASFEQSVEAAPAAEQAREAALIGALRELYFVPANPGPPVDGAKLALARAIPGGNERHAIGVVRGRYADLQAAVRGHPVGEQDLEMAANTWLALSEVPGISHAVRCDAWAELRAMANAPRLVTLRARHCAECDASTALALVAQAELYADWRDQTSSRHNRGFAGRLRATLHQLSSLFGEDHPEDLWAEVRSKASQTRSWTYGYVWRTGAVIALLAGITLLLAVCSAIGIFGANPWMPGFGNANTIDHVVDRRDMGIGAGKTVSADATGMAVSADDLVIAHGRGAMVFNRESRIARDELGDQPALDVAHRPGTTQFILPRRDQSVAMLDPAGTTDPKWLAAPTRLHWAGAALPASPLIIGMESTDDGPVLAVAGRGIARDLWSSAAPGVICRERSWKLGGLSNFPLEEASFATHGVWVRSPDGQLAHGDLRTLDETSRSLQNVRVARFDAERDRLSAVAFTAAGELYLHAASGSGWSGPYLGEGSKDNPLRDTADVELARLDKEISWFAGPRGLHAYDPGQRRISSVIGGTEVITLDPLPTPGDSAVSQVLVGSSTGLYRAAGPQPGFKSVALDASPVLALDLSADRRMCVYIARTMPSVAKAGASHGEEVRSLDPAGSGSHTVVVPVDAWNQCAAAPQVVGIEPLGPWQLFATSLGSFLYNPSTRVYLDCSSAQFTEQVNGILRLRKEVVRGFNVLKAEDGRMLSLTDQRQPMVLKTGDTPESTHWEALDAGRMTRPIGVAGAGDRNFGIEAGGTIHVYETLIRSFCRGSAAPIEPRTPATLPGDLFVAANDWSFRVLAGGRLCNYDSDAATISDSPLPEGVGEHDVAQIRLYGRTTALYRMNDGSVRSNAGTEKFGCGALPFEPDLITAVAPGRGTGRVLMGGPRGVVAEYEWSEGHFEVLGAAIAGAGSESVDEVLTIERGHLARIGSGIFYRNREKWTLLPGFTRFAAPHNQSRVWMLGARDVVRIQPDPNQPAAQWEREAFSCSANPDTTPMPEFLKTCVYAWQSSQNRIAFFSRDGEVGVYDIATDSWSVAKVFGRPSQFVAAGETLFVLDDRTVYRVTAILKSSITAETFAQADPGATHTSIHLTGNTLRLALVRDARPHLYVWPDINRKNDRMVFTRGREDLARDFDLNTVIEAREIDGRLMLVNSAARVALCEPVAGNWLCSGPSRETVVGIRRTGQPAQLMLKTLGGRTRIVSIEDKGLADVAGYSVAPENVERYLEAQGAAFSRSAAVFPHLQAGASAVKEMITQNLQHIRSFGAVGDGSLLDGKRFRVSRRQGAVVYQMLIGNAWRTLTVREGGFEHDTAQGVVLTPAGALWVLRSGELSLLEARDGVLTLTAETVASTNNADHAGVNAFRQMSLTRGGRDEVLFEETANGLQKTQAARPAVLATLDLKIDKIDFALSPEGGVLASWRAAVGRSPWDSRGKRLAIQAVSDVAQVGDDLLLSTELGMAVRNAQTYELKNVFRGLAGATFGRHYRVENRAGGAATSSERVLIKSDGVISREWNPGPGEAIALRGKAESVVPSGVWQFALSVDKPAPARITHMARGESRRFEKGKGGAWRFLDDQAVYLARDKGRATLRLVCKTHTWMFDAVVGRTEELADDAALRAGAAAGKIVEENQAGHAAIRLAFAGTGAASTVTFTALDDAKKSPFARGRLYCDAAAQVCGTRMGLYLLLDGRCVIRRDPAQPGQVTGCWKLPDIAMSGPIRMAAQSQGHDGVVLELSGPTADQLIACELSGLPPVWTQRVIPRTPLAPAGTIVWQRRADDTIVPLLRGDAFLENRAGSEALVPLQGWWHRDRFAWDRITQVGALDHTTVMLATPIGVQAVRLGASPAMLGFWVVRDVSLMCPAYAGERRQGVMFENSRTRWHAASSEPSGVHLQVITASPRRAFTLAVGYIGEKHERRIGLQQEMVPWAAPRELPRLRSVLGDRLPTPRLLHQGQFVFDYAIGACELTGAEQGRWLTFAPASDQTGFVCLNHFSSPSSGRAGLRLVDLWPSNQPIDRARAIAKSTVVALSRRPGGWSASKGVIEADQISWTPIALDDTREHFVTGQQAQWDPALMDLVGIKARVVWETGPALTPAIAGYPLLLDTPEGLTFGFDHVRSVAFDPQGNIYLGTRAGVLGMPCPADGRLLYKVNEPRRTLLGSSIHHADVGRVRCDSGGGVWSQFADGRVAPLSPAVTATQWPPLCPDYLGGALNLMPLQPLTSNDAFGLGRRQVGDILDSAPDPGRHAVWVQTKTDLFKVIPGQLEPELRRQVAGKVHAARLARDVPRGDDQLAVYVLILLLAVCAWARLRQWQWERRLG